MQRTTCFHFNPDLHSARANPGCLLLKGRTTDSFGTSRSRNMHIGKHQEEIQDVLQRELNALEDAMLPDNYDGPTYRLDPDA